MMRSAFILSTDDDGKLQLMEDDELTDEEQDEIARQIDNDPVVLALFVVIKDVGPEVSRVEFEVDGLTWVSVRYTNPYFGRGWPYPVPVHRGPLH